MAGQGHIRTKCLARGLVLLWWYAFAAQASAEFPSHPDTSFPFDIPSQSLGQSLDLFSTLTGFSVLFDSSHANLPSPAVRGEFNAAEALRLLLSDTGLKARWYGGSNAFGIAPDLVAPHMSGAAGTVSTVETGHIGYAAQVQRQLFNTLCRDAATRPGTYRLAMQLWFDESGRVDNVQLLSSTGDVQRDRAVIKLLYAYSPGGRPLLDMPQPITFLLKPDATGTASQCPST